MGHTKISTIQVYAKIVAAKVKEDMTILQARLDQQNPPEVKLLEVSMEEIIARHKAQPMPVIESGDCDSTNAVVPGEQPATQPAIAETLSLPYRINYVVGK